jgi:hypothetical protein
LGDLRILWGAKWPSISFVADNRRLWPACYDRHWLERRVVRFLVWAIAAAFRPRVWVIAENL